MIGLRAAKQNPSPLGGHPAFHAQRAEATLKQLGRREWWLWLSAFFVTTLSATALTLTAFPAFFRRQAHFYEMRPEQVRWATLCLLVLFNGWLVYRQWFFRRERRRFARARAGEEGQPDQVSDTGRTDPTTGLFTRTFAEQQLGKEIARAKRQNSALSLATIHLEEFDQLNERYGLSATDAALKELARRLKKACRGSDFAVRLKDDDFLLVLPECGLGEVKLVLNRLGPLEMNCAGRKLTLAYTTGWVDYQPGDLPSDMLKRATQLLHLYDDAAKESFSATLAPH